MVVDIAELVQVGDMHQLDDVVEIERMDDK